MVQEKIQGGKTVAKLNATIAVFAAFALLLAGGGLYVYFCNGGYSSDAHMNADGRIDYTISGPASVYGCSVFSDTDVPDRIYLYYDAGYKSDFNNAYEQKEFLDVLASLLERRGISTSFANAAELVGVMSNPNNAVMFVSGALPDTVYDGTLSSPFVTWMNAGGTVYWSGPEIGRYISTGSNITDLVTGFFAGDVCPDDKDKMYAYTESEMFRYTQARYDDCAYGLKADLANSKPLSYISKDGYSSISVAKLFNGNITVFGGNVALTENVSQVLTDRTVCADLLTCGLTYQSQGLERISGSINGRVSATTAVDVSAYSDVLIWMSTGVPATEWGKSIAVN